MISDFAGQGTNFGVRGATSADESDVMLKNYNPQLTNNPAVTSMVGTNDLPAYGGAYGSFKADVAGMIEWATIPRNAKVFFTDSQCSATGTWENATVYGFPGGVEQSTTLGSTLTCTIATQGPALYFGFMQDTSWTAGSMTVLIDGDAPSTNVTISSKNYFGAEETYKFTTVRYPLAPGSHTFQVTFSGAAGSLGTISPVWLGSGYPIGSGAISPPNIFVADVPVQENDATASLIATYNAALLSDIVQLQADGLPVVHVEENAASSGSGGASGTGWLNTGADFSGGMEGTVICPASNNLPLHPGNCGHTHLRDAFEYYILPAGQNGETAPYSQSQE
jgi:hypothetical protein